MKRKILLTAAIFLSLMTNAAMARESYLPKATKIVGGQKADGKIWGFYTSIARKTPDGKIATFCGASMIGARHAITAAHCVEQFNYDMAKKCDVKFLGANSLLLFPGISDFASAGIDAQYKVRKVTIHPKASCKKQLEDNIGQKYDNDIAIIELDRNWKGQIAEISNEISDDPEGPVKVAGFGKTESEIAANINARDGLIFQTHAKELLDVVLQTIPQEECAAGHKDTNGIISEKQICAGVRKRSADGFIGDSCNGDSGGPLIAYDSTSRPYQVGLVSWGPSKCGTLGQAGVYTRLSAYNNWIKGIVPQLKAATPIGKDETISEEASGIEALDNLLMPAENRIKVEICIETLDLKCGDNAFQIGYRAFAKVTSSLEGQVILIDQDAQNRLTQIFPNKKSLGHIKGEGARKSLEFGPYRVVEPFGKSKLIAILAPNDADLSAFLNSPSNISKGVDTSFIGGWDGFNGADSYAFNLANEIAAALNANETTVDLPNWGYSVLEYEVLP